MRLPTMIGLVFGLALMAVVLWLNDPAAIRATLVEGGWPLIPIMLIGLFPVLLDGIAWHALLPLENRPRLWMTLYARYVCQAVNGLLPVAQIGGEVARIRLARHFGVPLDHSVASVVTDMALQLGAQLLFALAGVMLLSGLAGIGGIGVPMALGIALSVVMLLALVLAQRAGIGEKIGRLISRAFGGATADAVAVGGEAVDRAIREVHRNRRALMVNFLWHMAGWPIRALEVYLVFHLIGQPISFGEAVILEGLVMVVRTAAFIVPAALGVQEGTLILLGGLLGIPPTATLALAVFKRGREVVVNLPGLLLWMLGEVRRPTRR